MAASKQTDTPKTLREKLAVIQKSLVVPKTQYNPFGKFNYRSCEDILEAVKPLLTDGLCLTISDNIVQVGDRHYVQAIVTLTDGTDKIVVSAYAREEINKKGMDGSQITGAASSYARKYALNGMFLIDDTKDADAQQKETEKVSSESKVSPSGVGVKQLDLEDFLPYVAGLFDGEGTAKLPYADQDKVTFKIVNTNKAILDKLKETHGGSVYVHSKGTEKNKPAWAWELTNYDDILALAQKIRPYLNIKANDVDSVINYISVKREISYVGESSAGSEIKPGQQVLPGIIPEPGKEKVEPGNTFLTYKELFNKMSSAINIYELDARCLKYKPDYLKLKENERTAIRFERDRRKTYLETGEMVAYKDFKIVERTRA